MRKKNLNISTRDIRFDILKIIGLFCIILAHTNPPPIINQLRGFDVPLLVIISGAVFGVSASKNTTFYSYLIKRIPRLLAPTWFFLLFYFITIYFLFLIVGKDYPFSQIIIIKSFALISGIGYVWIIRVFILVAIVAPLLYYAYNKINNNFYYLIVLSSIYIFYEIYYFYYNDFSIHFIDIFNQYFIFYLIPYGFLFGLGLCLPTFSQKIIYILLSLFLVLFVFLGYLYYSDQFIPTSLYKYPPRLYYISYAAASSLFLYFVINLKSKSIKSNNNLVTFISSSSLWIYLWHIFFIFVWDYSIAYYPLWINNFIFEFSFLILLSILITYSQKFIINNIIKKSKLGNKGKKVLSIVFLN